MDKLEINKPLDQAQEFGSLKASLSPKEIR
jgi:hypothetical protein